jgi:prolyl oligopeptidase
MRLLSLLAIITFVYSCKSSDSASLTTYESIAVTYPVTAKDTTVKDLYFGTTVADPYRWLEDDMSPATAEWVKAENAVTQDYFKKIPFRDAIAKRYEELYNYEKYNNPFKEGGYLYYYRNSGLQNQFVLYREKPGTASELFLDPNTFSKDGTTSLSGIYFSQDGSMAAYTISEGGSDWQRLAVINATSKQVLADTLDLKFSGAAWKGNEGFYYSTYAKPVQGSRLAGVTDNHKLYYHKLGTKQSEDKMVYGSDTKTTRYIWSVVSEDGRWLAIYPANETYGNAVYVQDLSKPNSAPVAVVSDMKNANGIIDIDDNYFYMQTDKDAPTGKVVAVPVNNPAMANWKTIIDAKPEVLTASAAGGNIFASYLKDAITKVYQYDMTGKQVREVNLPGLGTASGFGGKKKDTDFYYTYASYTNPAAIYHYDIAGGRSELYKESKLKFDPATLESKQVFYNSKDGTRIPMIITYKKGTELNGKNPTLLYGYGGFSASITPWFSTSNIILLENGGVFAVANIRGGGEYGEDWHQQGIKTKKQNVFNDFMAAAQYLVDSKYTSRDMLAIQGESNGGLLIGACITQDPKICKVAFPFVGVMDMLRYHKFTAGAGWSYDYGTSADSKEMFDYLYQYSPVHNVKNADYPATLIMTADHDDRVVPAHSFKFAAAMQAAQQGKNPVLIRIETKAGHGAGKSTQQTIAEQADKWSFMFYNMGVKTRY